MLKDLDRVELHTHPMTTAQYEMATTGDIAPFIDVFRTEVVKAMGIKDLRQFNEKALKMMLLTCLVLTGIFHVLSEKEFAQGYCDLFLSPMASIQGAKYAWMLEIKYLGATATEAEIEQAFAAAHSQLARSTSNAELLPTITHGNDFRAGTLLFVSNKDVLYRPFPA